MKFRVINSPNCPLGWVYLVEAKNYAKCIEDGALAVFEADMKSFPLEVRNGIEWTRRNGLEPVVVVHNAFPGLELPSQGREKGE